MKPIVFFLKLGNPLSIACELPLAGVKRLRKIRGLLRWGGKDHDSINPDVSLFRNLAFALFRLDV